MMHKQRVWQVGEGWTLDELVTKLTEYTWCGCNGFKTPGGTLWLNDCTSGDGAQEYGVIRRIRDQWLQVESITVSWCDAAKLRGYIETADAGRWDSLADEYPIPPIPDRSIQTPEEHVQRGRCGLCQ